MNANTRLSGDFGVPSMGMTALRGAYQLAEGISRATPPMQRPGYRLFWIDGNGSFGSVEVPAVDGAYTIIGRHERCDVMLKSDPEIALRHLLARAVVTPDGAVGLRLVDLHTSLAFHLETDEPVRSMFSTGPVAVRLGRYALVALPSSAEALPPQLPPADVEHASGSPYRTAARKSPRLSHIMIMSRATLMGELARKNKGFARVTIERGGRIESLEVSEPELEKGVLLGRAERANQQLQVLLAGTISRVHMMFLREGSDTVVYDLASMHGTYTSGQRVRRLVLPEHTAAKLSLGNGEVIVRWHPHRA